MKPPGSQDAEFTEDASSSGMPWVLDPLPLSLLVFMTATMNRKQVGEERVYLAYFSISLFIIKGS